MRLTPQPTVDNSQAKMMKFMPCIFMLICYSYSCALVALFDGQRPLHDRPADVINRMKDAGDPTRARGAADEAAAASR